MAQQPVLRGEVGARVRVPASKACFHKGFLLQFVTTDLERLGTKLLTAKRG